MRFRILGPPRIQVAQGPHVTLPPRYWQVLVSMLLRPNMAVSARVLAANAWGEEAATPAACGTVRSYISKIGKTLHQVGAGEVRISRQERGYALSIDPQSVDLHQFRALGRQAAAVADSGDYQHAALLLREAEALWQGPALAGLDGDWISRMRDSLEEERRAARIQRIGVELHLGRHSELLGELHLLTEQYPFDEKIIEFQMTALYRCGRQADALVVYRKSRDRLVQQGLEPGDSLTGHHLRILRRDPGLSVTPAYLRPGQAKQPDTLPPDLRDFIGREAEIGLLTAEIERERRPLLQVLEGMAGAGKTSLAVHLAHSVREQFPDAALYLDFCAHSPGQPALGTTDALHRLLRMLDVPAERIPATMRERAALWQSELAHRRAVIVLDDVTAPDAILPIVPVGGDCLTIVTSRRRHPDWAGRPAQALGVLPDADAITMFTRIAGPDTAIDTAEIARAVQLCGHLPLAIRVIATWLRDHPGSELESLLDELSDVRFGYAPAHMLSEQVMSAFALSYRWLSAPQRRVFRYLGISPCPDISVHAAAALTSGTLADTEAVLGALQDHHLLGQFSPGRFQSHDLVRAFAGQRFWQEETETERRRAVGRLLDYYLRTANRADQVLYAPALHGRVTDVMTPPQPAISTPQEAREWLEREWANILRLAQHAARHEHKQHCADLTHTLAEFLDTSGYWHYAAAAHTLALQACRDLGDQPRTARAALDLSLTSLRTAKHEAALQHALDAALIYRTLVDRQGHAAALDRIGAIYRYSARYRDSLAHHQEAMDIHRQIGDEHGLARDLGYAGITYNALGEYARAISYFNQSRDIYQRIGDRRGEARALMNICATQGDQGYHRDALQNCQKSLAIFREIGGHRQQISLLLHNMGEIYRYKGEHRKALAEYRDALVGYRALGDRQHQSRVLCDIGLAYLGLECYSEALVHHEKAESISSEIDDPFARVKALCGMADAHRGIGSYTAALDHYEQARRLAREIEALYLEAKALYGMAETLLHTQGRDAARIYWREAYEIFTRLGAPEAALLEIRLDPVTTPAS